VVPSGPPSFVPSEGPTVTPTSSPSGRPSFVPTSAPSTHPSETPTAIPSDSPSFSPVVAPSSEPTMPPTQFPSIQASGTPSIMASKQPSRAPSTSPVDLPTIAPTVADPIVVPTLLTPTGAPPVIGFPVYVLVPPSVAQDPNQLPGTTIPLTGQPSSTILSPTPPFDSLSSSSPTETGSGMPSSSPSAVPTASVSSQPSQTLSDMPIVITSQPSDTPSETPSSSPFVSDPEAEDACVISVKAKCTLGGDGPLSGQPCESPGIGIEPCYERPTAAVMLFNGGDCSQSDNRQFLQFDCRDTMQGPPPTEEGAEAFIVVTDIEGRGNVYHQDWVKVGSNYDLVTPEGEDRFTADQRILIYSSNVTSASNLLQDVVYHSSCSSNLELKNRFGASQLVQFTNSMQGNVTCFASARFDYEINIPLSLSTDPIRLEKLSILSSFDGFQDLSEQVGGLEFNSSSPVTIGFNANFDLTRRQRYTLFTQLEGTRLSDSKLCRGQDFETFFAGNPVPAGIPTPAPSAPPSISPAPTTDADTTACSVDAEIVCETLNDAGRVLQQCDDVVDPRNYTCADNSEASGLGFKYLGGDGLPDPAWLTVSGGRTGVAFSGPVSVNQAMYTEGNFRGLVTLRISTIRDDEMGDILQTIPIDARCLEGSDTLRLTNRFGPLELTAYRNALGIRSSVLTTRLRYIAVNSVPLQMIADTGVVTSGFSGTTFDALFSSNVTIGPRQSSTLFEEIQLIDFGAKSSRGIELAFTLNVTGVGQRSNLPCDSQDTYQF